MNHHLTTHPIKLAFDEFWNRYPRKVGKGAARKAHAAALKKASVEEIMSGVERATGEWSAKKTEMQFIPHPATWLNQERWADDHPGDKPAEKTRGPEWERARKWNLALASAGLDPGDFNPFAMTDRDLETAIRKKEPTHA